MYNKELKDMFICSRRAVDKTFLKSLEKEEFEYNLDLCQLPADIVKKGLESYCGFRSSNEENNLSNLRQYCLFCEEKGLSINKDLLSIESLDLTEGAKKYLVSSPEDLYNVLNESFFPPEMETADCLYRSFLWSAFSGVPYKDVKRLIVTKRDDLDVDKKIFNVNNNIYELYEQSIMDFSNLKYLNEFRRIHPLYDKVVYKDRVFSMFLFRGEDNPKSSNSGHVSLNTLTSAVKTKQNNSGSKKILRFKNTFLSGLFYRSYLAEKEGLTPDFSSYMRLKTGEDNITQINLEEKTKKERKAFLGKYRFIVRDYETWKRAFDLK